MPSTWIWCKVPEAIDSYQNEESMLHSLFMLSNYNLWGNVIQPAVCLAMPFLWQKTTIFFIHLQEMLADVLYVLILYVTSTVFESKDKPTQMTKQSFTIVDFITYRKSIHFKFICKDVHS